MALASLRPRATTASMSDAAMPKYLRRMVQRAGREARKYVCGRGLGGRPARGPRVSRKVEVA